MDVLRTPVITKHGFCLMEQFPGFGNAETPPAPPLTFCSRIPVLIPAEAWEGREGSCEPSGTDMRVSRPLLGSEGHGPVHDVAARGGGALVLAGGRAVRAGPTWAAERLGGRASKAPVCWAECRLLADLP